MITLYEAPNGALAIASYPNVYGSRENLPLSTFEEDAKALHATGAPQIPVGHFPWWQFVEDCATGKWKRVADWTPKGGATVAPCATLGVAAYRYFTGEAKDFDDDHIGSIT